jgi:hypothetical protein
MNLSAIAFVVGSVLFAAASVPYLWPHPDPPIRDLVFTFVARQYVIASLLFFLGGAVNYWRAYLVVQAITGDQRPAGNESAPSG